MIRLLSSLCSIYLLSHFKIPVKGEEMCTFTSLALPSGGNLKFISPQEIGHLIETNLGRDNF